MAEFKHGDFCRILGKQKILILSVLVFKVLTAATGNYQVSELKGVIEIQDDKCNYLKLQPDLIGYL